MKKPYLKPELEEVEFIIDETITSNEFSDNLGLGDEGEAPDY